MTGADSSGPNTDELLTKLLDKLGLNNTTNASPSTASHATNNITLIVAVANPIGSPAQPVAPIARPATPTGSTGSMVTSGQATTLPHAFIAGTLHDLASGTWNMDTVLVSDGHSIPVTNTGHSILPTSTRSLHLNNVLITPHIVKIHQFVRDNNCTMEFDAFGFFVKDFMTHRVLLQHDSTGDLYSVTQPSPIPHAFLTSQHTWHRRLGHPGSEVLRRLVSHNLISYTKEKPPCDHGGEFDNRALHALFASEDGTLSHYKARLVANGSTQLEGVDVDETFSPAFLQQIITSLHQEFSMIDLGSLNYFLGISITRDSSGMFLSQKKYIVKILEKAHMVNCNPSRTPIDTESKLGIDGDPVSDPTLYQSLISRYVPDWAGFPTTRCSTLGYCVFLGNNLLSWSFKRQPTLSCSSAEAEYRGVSNVVAETFWLRNLLLPSILSSSPVQHQRTKHIEIDIHFVWDLVAAGQVPLHKDGANNSEPDMSFGISASSEFWVIPDFLTWKHSCSCVSDDLPTDGYDWNDVERLCARLIYLREIREEVLVRSVLSSVWFNKECDPVFRRIDDNSEMSIYDFMTFPSWGDAKVVEESYHLSSSLLECVSPHTTAPAGEGDMISLPTPDKIAASLPDLRLAKKSKGPS
ncbi:ribonuclease H-like domain-containing protein [Tanacetum coccineum]